jgi:hypothetical protein
MNIQIILGHLQGCHSVLALGWPRPGIPQMAGARIFIGTNPFFALEDGIQQASAEFEILCKNPNMQTACQAWLLVTQIVVQFRTLGRQSQSAAIDPAFNLIYLTTGVLYHHISSIFSVTPKSVQPFATVESLEKLLGDCSWGHSKKHISTEEILASLIVELRNKLVELQK